MSKEIFLVIKEKCDKRVQQINVYYKNNDINSDATIYGQGRIEGVRLYVMAKKKS